MSKLLVFYLLYRITGNPLLAILVLLVIYYFVDRRYVGLLPNVMTPIRRQVRASNLHRQLSINPHDTPAKLELAQQLMDRRRFRSALQLLESVPAAMQESPDVLYDVGLCEMELGRVEAGESRIRQALAKDPGLRYGDPYLRLATLFASSNPEKSMDYLMEFQQRNYSSCHSEYLLGLLLSRLNDRAGARAAWSRCAQTYRALPTFRKRLERRWVVLANLRRLFS